METIDIALTYDPLTQLHELPFSELTGVNSNVQLRLRATSAGVREVRGMAAIKDYFVTPREIQRALSAALAYVPKPQSGMTAIIMAGCRYEITNRVKTESLNYVVETLLVEGDLPLGFPGESVTVTTRYLLIPSWTLAQLTRRYAEQGVRVIAVEFLVIDELIH
jgi:hypothetical protein